MTTINTIRLFVSGTEGDSGTKWYRAYVLKVQEGKVLEVREETNWPSRAEASLWADHHGEKIPRVGDSWPLRQEKHDTMTDKRWCVYALVCLLISAGIVSLTFVV